MKPRMSSCARIFEQRGDPWYPKRDAVEPPPLDIRPDTEDILAKMRDALVKEGITTRGHPRLYAKEKRDAFRRENGLDGSPDMDMFTKAKKAKPRFPLGSEKRTPIVADTARKLANIRRRMNRKMAGDIIR